MPRARACQFSNKTRFNVKDRNSKVIKVFNLDEDTKKKEMFMIFREFGFINHCEVPTDVEGKCTGVARITFNESVAAANASASSGMLKLRGRTLYIFLMPIHIPHENIIFVRNIPANLSEHEVESLFLKCGAVLETRIKSSNNKRILNCASVSFIDAASAKKAIDQMDGLPIENQVFLEVIAFRSWSYRQQCSENLRKWNEELYASPDTTLHVTLFDASLTEEGLRDLFSKAGPVEAVRIAMTVDGRRKNYGFVRFRTKEEVRRALRIGIGIGRLLASKLWPKASLAVVETPAETVEIDMQKLQILGSSLLIVAIYDQQRLRNEIGNTIYPFVHSIYPKRAGEITGLIIATSVNTLRSIIQSRENLQFAVERCMSALDS